MSFAIFLRELQNGWRSIRASPGLILLVVVTLALGIGANTAIFSVVDAVLLQPPPYPGGERLVQGWELIDGQKIPVSWLNFQHLRGENRGFENMAGVETADLTLTGRGDARVTHAGVVSASFFRLTGWQPAAGRVFADADDRPGAAPCVLVTGEFWAHNLGADSHTIGKTLTLDGKPYQVIGILPPGLKYFTQPIDFYLPIGPRDGVTIDRSDHGAMMVLGLLRRGVSLTVARRELDAIMRRLAVSDPGPESSHRTAVDWFANLGLEDVRETLVLLMGAVVLVLIIACANVASLLLVRGTARAREFAIRTAIGAGRWRLTQQLIIENFMIAGMGGVAGLLLAMLALRVLLRQGPQDVPRLWEVGLSEPVLWFTAGITALTGLLAGLAPVVYAGKVDLTLALREGSAGAGASKRGNSLRSGLLVAEIASTLVLSFACGLLLHSLILAQNHYPGFRSAGVLALELELPPARYQSDDSRRQFYQRLLRDLRNKPGVQSVGAVNCPPSTGGCARGWYSIVDMPTPGRANVPLTLLSSVDPGYFRALSIPLLAGRNFTDADGEHAPCAAIVNETLARHWWRATPQLAVGHRLKLGGPYVDGGTCEIVGVVGGVSQGGLDAQPVAEIHVPFAQSASAAMVIMLRGADGEATRLIPNVRREVAALDPRVAIQSLRPFDEWMGATLARRRFTTQLLTIFTILAAVLAVVGIYGVLNYWVRTRQKEIAIRMALGARPAEILRWTGGYATRLTVFGIAAGILGGWGGSRWLGSLVFGISPTDPFVMLAAAAAVITIAAVAASVPAWRAAAVDPIRYLRDG